VFDSIPYDHQSQIILWNDGVKMKLLWVCHGKMTMTLLAIVDPKRSSFRLVAVSYSTILFHHFYWWIIVFMVFLMCAAAFHQCTRGCRSEIQLPDLFVV
jgi:hypothetical protein